MCTFYFALDLRIFLARSVVDYLFGGISNVKACINDASDEWMQSKLRKVYNNF